MTYSFQAFNSHSNSSQSYVNFNSYTNQRNKKAILFLCLFINNYLVNFKLLKSEGSEFDG